jgi:protease-4
MHDPTDPNQVNDPTRPAPGPTGGSSPQPTQPTQPPAGGPSPRYSGYSYQGAAQQAQQAQPGQPAPSPASPMSHAAGQAGGPPPPKPPSSLGSVLLILFGLASFFLCFVGLGVFLLFHLVGGSESGSSSGGLNISFGDKIGLVRLEGVIMPGPDMIFWLNSMRDMAETRSIRGIVLRIDSPGGSVGASQELQSMVLKIRNEYEKPVYVSMGDVAASGGYYIAAAADEIYALKGTLTGSIGVILSKPDLSKLTEKIGIEMETVKSGRFKDAGASTRPLSELEREMFDHLIQNTHQQFLDDVLAHREPQLADALKGLSSEAWEGYLFDQEMATTASAFLATLADGRVYTGQQALELGLVDSLGTLDDTIRAMADRLNISGRPTIHEASRQPTFREIFGAQVDRILPSAAAPLQYRMVLP